LAGSGSTGSNTAQLVTGGPRQSVLDPNQSPNTARGPPPPSADPTNPNTAPITSGPADPVVSGTALGTIAGPTAPGRPTTNKTATGTDSVPGLGQFARPGATVPPLPAQQESGFVSSVHRFGQMVGIEPDPNLHNTGEGYVPAHDGIPAKVDRGDANFEDMTKPEAEVLGVLPAGRTVKGVELGVEAAGKGLNAWQESHPSSPPATRSTPNGSGSEPAADTGPGRLLPRPNRTPGDGTAHPAPRPQPATAPAGRPRPGTDVRPSGPAGSRPGQRIGSPRTDREPAPVGAGSPTKPATGGRSPQALTTPGTRTAPARPQTPRIDEPAPARTLPNTRPAPDAAPGGQPRLPAPAPTATGPRSGLGTDVGPSVPTTPHQVGQPSSPDTNNPPITRSGGQPDGPATVGGGEKTRGNRYQNGTLERWDAGQQRWLPIAGPDGGATPTTAGGDPTSNSGHPRISDLDENFHGQPDELLRYQKLSRTPADQLSDADYKFVYGTRKQLTLGVNEPMTKVLGKDGVDKIVGGAYAPDQVIGFVARGRDTDQLRTPQQLRDGLALTPPLKPDGTPTWESAIPADGSYAYQLTWRARDDRGLSVPYGAPKGAAVPHIDNLVRGEPRRDGEPFTGTGTTAGGIPEWHADGAPITGPAQIWHIDQAGNRSLYADYDPGTRTWKLAP
jgi:hypothetical protein